MVTAVFDTHRFVKRLQETGMPIKQAEELIDIVSEIRDEAKEKLATKADLELQKREIIISTGAMLFALAGFLKFFGH